jgi:hypothetical protein
VVDGIGGTLKRPVWLEILAGKRCSSAEGFVKISRVKTKAISVILVRQAQLDVTKTTLAKVFSNISNITNLQKQHSIKVLQKDIIQIARYSTSDDQCVFLFYHFIYLF